MPHKDIEAKRAYDRIWREKHQESIRRSSRKYMARKRAENPERIRMQRREYDAQHKDHIRKRQAQSAFRLQQRISRNLAWKRTRRIIMHKVILAQEVLYRMRNRTNIRVNSARWRMNHPEKELERSAKRRACLKGALVNDFIAYMWDLIRFSYQDKCIYCGIKYICLTQDHVVPLVRGGGHTAINIVPACRSCNGKKSDGPPLEMLYEFPAHTECA